VMHIARHHDRRFVPQEPLQLAQLHSCLNLLNRKRVPQIVEIKQ
jgi:hypothetical protein